MEDVWETRAEDRILHHHPDWRDTGWDTTGGGGEGIPSLHCKEALCQLQGGGVVGVGRALHPKQQHEEVADGAEDDLVSLHSCAEVLRVEGHVCTLAAAEQVVQVCVVMRGFTLQDRHLFCKRS